MLNRVEYIELKLDYFISIEIEMVCAAETCLKTMCVCVYLFMLHCGDQMSQKDSKT